MSKFYLNGRIKDKYRKVFTGNGAITNLDERYSSTDMAYFDKYKSILINYLEKKNNILFSMTKFEIYNPFYRYAYSSGLLNDAGINDWNWIDFFKFDIKKLCSSNYDYMVLLPNWWRCKEAWSKLLIAKSLGVKIISFRKLIKELS